MPITSSISKTSIRPVVELNNTKTGAFSKNLLFMVKKESFWNKKTVLTKPKKPYLKPEFKPQDELDAKTFSLNIFSNKKSSPSKK